MQCGNLAGPWRYEAPSDPVLGLRVARLSFSLPAQPSSSQLLSKPAVPNAHVAPTVLMDLRAACLTSPDAPPEFPQILAKYIDTLLKEVADGGWADVHTPDTYIAKGANATRGQCLVKFECKLQNGRLDTSSAQLIYSKLRDMMKREWVEWAIEEGQPSVNHVDFDRQPTILLQPHLRCLQDIELRTSFCYGQYFNMVATKPSPSLGLTEAEAQHLGEDQNPRETEAVSSLIRSAQRERERERETGLIA